MGTICIDDREIYYQTSADPLSATKKTLLFIHGAGGTKNHWFHQFGGLKSKFNIVVVELPGHGASSAQGANRVERYAEDIAHVIDAVAPTPPVLAGHSMGGAIAQIVALNFTKKISGLILVGTGCRLKVVPSILDGLLEDFGETVKMINRYAFSKKAPDTLVQQGTDEMIKTPPSVLHGDFLACDRFDICEKIGNISHPALILCGEDDRLTPVKYSEFLLKNLPDASLKTFPEAGHMVMMEKPEEVNAAIQHFAASLG
jgi:pimeloyl-ACP methyl ester carboxylesterase